MKKEAFVEMALTYCGYPSSGYQGPDLGCSTEGFDCSGFHKFILLQAGYPEPIPRHSNELFDYFGILIHQPFLKLGDLIFFSNKGGQRPDHVGIMVSQREYIHAPGKDNTVVCLRDVKRSIIKPKDGGEQIYFSNPIGYKRITISSGKRYQRPFLE